MRVENGDIMSNGEKRVVSWFEKFVFAVTRVFALCGAAVMVIGIIILAIKLLSPGEGITVNYAEVVNRMPAITKSASPETAAIPSNTITAIVPIPEDLKPYFKGDNAMVLQHWIEDLSEAQQRDFLANMSHVVREAEANRANPNDAINTYKVLKLKKLGSDGFDRKINEYREIALKVGYVAGIFGFLFLLSIISLVLVMLAIERNTRPVST